MPNHAHITLIGYLGKDPVLDDKTEAARFTVAHTRKRKAGDCTTWYQVTAWRQTAKICGQYLRKGDLVGISGQPYMDVWKNKDGVDVHTMKIDASEVILMGQPHKVETERLSPVRPVTPLPRAAAAADDDEPLF